MLSGTIESASEVVGGFSGLLAAAIAFTVWVTNRGADKRHEQEKATQDALNAHNEDTEWVKSVNDTLFGEELTRTNLHPRQGLIKLIDDLTKSVRDSTAATTELTHEVGSMKTEYNKRLQTLEGKGS